MKAILSVTLILLCSGPLFPQQDRFIVKFGEKPSHVLPGRFRFLNDEFRKGFLSFPMGKKYNVSMLNYDLYYEHLTLINEKKDTLVIKEDEGVKYAQIGNEKFYHDVEKGYLKILVTDSLHSLTSHTRLSEGRLAPRANDEGYGGSNSTAASETSSRNQDMIFTRTSGYFLLDQSGVLTKCNKSGFLKMFHDKDDLVKSYIKQENINFSDETDLVKLFNYCLSLIAVK